MQNRGNKLRQACDQKSLDRTLEDAHRKLDEMERALKSQDFGHDLRSVKQLITRHTLLEQEMTTYHTRIEEIIRRAETLAVQGHFDAKKIQTDVDSFTKRWVQGIVLDC